jgi:hypothetical protein
VRQERGEGGVLQALGPQVLGDPRRLALEHSDRREVADACQVDRLPDQPRAEAESELPRFDLDGQGGRADRMQATTIRETSSRQAP